jgi:hypothetical protein
MKKLLPVVLFLLASVFCFGQKIRYTTIKCTLSKGAKDSIEKLARYELNFYKTIFTIKKIPTIMVKLYGDQDRFEKSEETVPRWNRSQTGYYTLGNREVGVFKDEHFVATSAHEINHFIFHTQFDTIPTWVNEGLSCYFEYAAFDSSGNVVIQPWRYGKRRIKELLLKNKADVKQLAYFSPKKFYKGSDKKELDHYVQAWAMVYFLMETKREVMKDIIKNNTPDAIEMCYKGGMVQFQKDFCDYYK